MSLGRLGMPDSHRLAQAGRIRAGAARCALGGRSERCFSCPATSADGARQLHSYQGYTGDRASDERATPGRVLGAPRATLSRAYVAGVFWPDCSSWRSLPDLGTALWHANHSGAPVVAAAGLHFRLRPEAQVDVRALMELGCATSDCMARSVVVASQAGMSWSELSQDLLPDWYDDWLVETARAYARCVIMPSSFHPGTRLERSPCRGYPGGPRHGQDRAHARDCTCRADQGTPGRGQRSEAVPQFRRCG